MEKPKVEQQQRIKKKNPVKGKKIGWLGFMYMEFRFPNELLADGAFVVTGSKSSPITCLTKFVF